MDEFDNTGQGDRLVAPVAAETGCQQQQRRADTFSAAGKYVFADLAYQGYVGFQILAELQFNVYKIFANDIQCGLHQVGTSEG